MINTVLKKLKVLLIPFLIIAVIGFLAFDLSDRYVKPVKTKSKNTAALLELLKKDITEATKVALDNISKKVPSSSSLPEVLTRGCLKV